MLPQHLWALISSAVSVLAATTSTKRATICNGHAQFCSRLYSNVTYVGAHDSFAFSSDPLALARAQEVNITAQLQLGVRLLQAQAHMNSDNVLHFCHTSCLLFDGGSVLSYLQTVKTFLDENPNEVLTLLFTNPEGLSPATVWKPIFDAAGISNLTYIPPSLPVKQSDWPTLGSMIDAGTRVVVFLDSQADGPEPVNFILPEFSMVWENPFSVTNASFPCSVNRIHGPLATEDHIYLINHVLDKDIIPIGSGVLIPDPFDASTTNGVTSILADANGCVPLGGNRAPSFVLLDFVNIGEGFKAADMLNGIASSIKQQCRQRRRFSHIEQQQQVGGSSDEGTAREGMAMGFMDMDFGFLLWLVGLI
ncbi:Transcription factor IIIB 60 kDa subunit [Mycena venus]|uniref:Transcription factor IIIB 60 kDa subunit n=1 Tax=Mycena venus TaxID=2733690 RepID=A0A8H7CXE0_9AGAR|nr:Transcription factor IIIB 60 kDa subunit [Mycena venus]